MAFSVSSATNGSHKVHVQLTAGTNGTVPSAFTRAREVASITKGTHTYAVKFVRGRTALLDWSVKVIQATPDVDGAWEAKVIGEDIAGTTKTITIGFFAADGTPVDMATGDVLRACFELKTSPGLA